MARYEQVLHIKIAPSERADFQKLEQVIRNVYSNTGPKSGVNGMIPVSLAETVGIEGPVVLGNQRVHFVVQRCKEHVVIHAAVKTCY